MSKQPTTFRWICPTCEDATTVKVWPVIPAKIAGPPEDCYPAEGGEYEPTECQHCGQPISDSEAHSLAWDVEQGRADSAAEAKFQARRDSP